MNDENAIWLQGVLTTHRYLIEGIIGSSLHADRATAAQFDAIANTLKKQFALRMRAPRNSGEQTDLLAIQRAAMEELDRILASVRSTLTEM